ncbi:hypothetical protein HDU78_001894 [Chytriomyces hyalinus]|nr:hypothetical protein HDU78_001894 [Chytriomyces hyalinus]
MSAGPEQSPGAAPRRLYADAADAAHDLVHIYPGMVDLVAGAKMQLLTSVDLDFANAPNFFSTVRPDAIDSKISNTVYSQRISDLNALLHSCNAFQSHRHAVIIATSAMSIFSILVIAVLLSMQVESLPAIVGLAAVVALALVIRVSYFLHTPKYILVLNEQLSSWGRQDQMQGINMYYKLRHTRPMGFHEHRPPALSIEILQHVLTDAEMEHFGAGALPAYTLPALARIILASKSAVPGMFELQSPSIERRPLDEILPVSTVPQPDTAADKKLSTVITIRPPLSSNLSASPPRNTLSIHHPPLTLGSASSSPSAQQINASSPLSPSSPFINIASADRASITSSVGPPDYRSMASGVLPTGIISSANAPTEFAEKLRLIEVVTMSYSDSPIYFSILRPEVLENRISNITYSSRMAALNAQLSSKTDFKSFRRPLFYLSLVLIAYFFTAAVAAYLIPDIKIAMDISAGVALALVLGLRLGALSYRPKYLKTCADTVKTWTREDAVLGVNLVYKFSHAMPTDFDTLRYCCIEIYEKVLYNHREGIVEMCENLPAYAV